MSAAAQLCLVCRAASVSPKQVKELDSILESQELSARQEAALIANCKPEGQADANSASPVDQVREESILAGLGVISPSEIGTSALSK